MEWMILPLKRYADFRGRSRRKEFWMWVLFLIIASVLVSMIDVALGLGGSGYADATGSPTGFQAGAGLFGGVLTIIFSLAVLIPNLAVQVRRLHDINRTGWWLLVPILSYILGVASFIGGFFGGGAGLAAIGLPLIFVAGISGLVLLVFFCLDGTRGPNRYGPDPKDPAAGRNLEEVFR